MTKICDRKIGWTLKCHRVTEFLCAYVEAVRDLGKDFEKIRHHLMNVEREEFWWDEVNEVPVVGERKGGGHMRQTLNSTGEGMPHTDAHIARLIQFRLVPVFHKNFLMEKQ